MTVAAIDSQSGDVMLMTEGDRLFAGDSLIGGIRRTNDASDDPEDEGDDEHRTEDRDARKGVRAAVKNLRHYSGAIISTLAPATRDTPPEITSAMTEALSIGKRSTRELGTTTRPPAMLYENGR